MTFSGVLLAILLTNMLYATLAAFRSAVAYDQQMRICEAIYHYKRFCIDCNIVCEVDFEDMEPFNDTAFRVWDWTDKNILSPEKYQLIEPFIKKEE